MKKGFTLIEVMLAGAILAIGCLGVLSMTMTVINQNNISKNKNDAMYLAELMLNQMELEAQSSSTIGNSLWSKVQGSTSGWVNAGNYSKTGQALKNDQTDKPFTISVKLLPTSGILTDTRGALRVVWQKNGAGACPAEEMAVMNSRPSKVCDMITLPFAFSDVCNMP